MQSISSQLSGSTALLPIIWRRDHVHDVKVNLEFAEFLSKRSWHLTSMTEAKPPRTSFALNKRNYNLWLHRIVVTLGLQESIEEAARLFENTEKLVTLSSRIPQLAFANNMPFDCRIQNIMLKYQNVSVLNAQISLTALELPASALLQKFKQDKSSWREGEREEEVQEPTLPPLIETDEVDSNYQVLKDVFDILGGEK